MDKNIKISRLEQKLSKSQEEIRKLKSELRSVKSEKRKDSKKKDAKNAALTKEQQQLLLKLLNDTLTPGF